MKVIEVKEVTKVLVDKESVRISVIDQDPDSQTILSELIQNLGFEVRVEEDVQRAFRQLESQEFGVIITDNMLNGYCGLEVMRRAESGHPLTEVIIVTGEATVAPAMAAIKQGAHSCTFQLLNIVSDYVAVMIDLSPFTSIEQRGSHQQS